MKVFRALVTLCVLCAAVLCAVNLSACAQASSPIVTVGFIYDNEETTPYSYNFLLAQEALQEKYGSRVKVVTYSNVMEESVEIPTQKLLNDGCQIIFTNGYGNLRNLAKANPNVQFCQVSNDPYPEDEAANNYHTFKGEIYQGRYASGVVAGLKLQDLIDQGEVNANNAQVGFVAAFPYPEVISGYTAFFLGVRSVVPQATMRVRYTYTWSNYVLEKDCAIKLLNEGCSVISQHSDTVGPAVACEEYYARDVFHVGYNISMIAEAPNASLTSTRINWTPYVLGAVEAVMDGRTIEDVVDGRVHPLNDMSAGIDKNWVELLEINEDLMPEDSREKINQVLAALASDSVEVFMGDYVGVNPADPSDTVNLQDGFAENANSSIPSFHYVLQDVVTTDN